MNAHNGSAVDPVGEVTSIGSPPAPTDTSTGFADERFRAQCEAFRAMVPSGVKLWIGLTPEPAGVCSSQRAEEIRRTLLTLKNYLRADRILTRLPAAFPDHYFSTTTHLNPLGARQFTHALAGALEEGLAASARNFGTDRSRAQGSAGSFISATKASH
jgi:hypothetical protein